MTISLIRRDSNWRYVPYHSLFRPYVSFPSSVFPALLDILARSDCIRLLPLTMAIPRALKFQTLQTKAFAIESKA